MTTSWIYKYPPPASEQPEALRLADALEQDYCSCHEGFKIRNRIDPQCESCQTKDWRNEAAAELRRLHQLALDQQGQICALNMARSMEQKTAALKAEELERCKQVCAATSEAWREESERTADAHLKQGLTIAELFEQRDALLEALQNIERSTYDTMTATLARAAIAAVEGEKT